MNRLVRERYPVDKLPEDLRQGFEGREDVRVTIDAIEGSGGNDEQVHGSGFVPFPSSPVSALKHLRRENFSSDAAADSYVASLRGEWVHRER